MRAPKTTSSKARSARRTPEDLQQLPAPGSAEYARLSELGAQALREGQVALLVLAGGMATRMGGVIKALVDAIPGKSFLDLRRAEMRALERRYGAAPPLWLMTSHSTDAGIRAALGDDLDGESIATFNQHLSLARHAQRARFSSTKKGNRASTHRVTATFRTRCARAACSKPSCSAAAR